MRGSASSVSASQTCISARVSESSEANGSSSSSSGAAGEQRAQKRDALPHPARELVRRRALEPAQPEALEQRGGPAPRLAPPGPCRLQRERGVPERVPPGQQQVLLRHVGAGWGLDGTRVGVLEAGQELEERGLPAPGWHRPGRRSHPPRRPGRRPRAPRPRRSGAPGRVPGRPPASFMRVVCNYAPFAGITPQVRRVSTGLVGAISARLREPPCYALQSSLVRFTGPTRTQASSTSFRRR